MNEPRLPSSMRLLLTGYNLLWPVAVPLLLASSRVREGLGRRMVHTYRAAPADVWIQAASTGEAAIAAEIVRSWPTSQPLSFVVTTNTLQGMEVLKQVQPPGHSRLTRAYCPLDSRKQVRKFLKAFKPSLLVLLETELWPIMLHTCKQESMPVLLLNARLSAHSLAQYLMLPDLWPPLAPDEILAVSEWEAERYAVLFDRDRPQTMPNIKFDRCSSEPPVPYVHNPLSDYIKAQSRFIVFGSVRREEESSVLPVISRLLQEHPRSIIGVFPRHLNRLPAWQQGLKQLDIPFQLRSKLSGQITQGTVVLWDTFGELEYAYALARTAFVGGSLAPLGGQNFLEPLSQGVIPIIGPHWHHFDWVGQDIVHNGLVTQVHSLEELQQALLSASSSPPERETVHNQFLEFVQARRGGTQTAVRTIRSSLAGLRRAPRL